MLCDILKQLRSRTPYTQQNIADVLGIDRSTYSYYESGKTEPNTATLIKLSHIFKANIEDIFPGAYKPDSALVLEDEVYLPAISDEMLRKFAQLARDEQLLIMLYRLCDDKEKLLETAKELTADKE